MSIQIKLFGPLVDVIGRSEIEIRDISDSDSLKKQMMDDFPDLKSHVFLISVCRKIVLNNVSLKSGDEVAFLPPFAGG